MMSKVRPECDKCVSYVKDKGCVALSRTNFPPDQECPFLCTPERLKRDQEILAKAIKEKRVSPRVVTNPYI